MKVVRNKYGKLVKVPLLAPYKSTGYAGEPVRIQFGRTKCKFLSAYPPQLDRALTAPHPGFQFTTAFKNKSWDGLHHFITRAGYFPTGLLPLVVHILKTGINPLIESDKKGYSILKVPPGSQIICNEKDTKFYHSSYLSYYEMDTKQVASSLSDEGVFAYPVEIFRSWAAVTESNPLARKVLKLAKNLHLR